MEVERKFLAELKQINELIKKENLKGTLIRQYYIKTGYIEERYRSKGEKYYHTTKQNIDGLSREENEVECSKKEFEDNQKDKTGQMIEKTRYVLPVERFNLEIDIYSGALNGLCICEVEFKNASEAKDFIFPKFCLREVTIDPSYKNQSLALYGLKRN